MITEDYVSFETAKILKEKGFDENCAALYDLRDGAFREKQTGYVFNNYQWDNFITAPTIQMAMKWLRKIHNILVSPYALSTGYYFEIFDLTNRDISGCKPLYKVGIPRNEDVLSTYEEACEAAIKYCLENLI